MTSRKKEELKPKNKTGKASHRMQTLNHSQKDGKSKDGKATTESNELGVELTAREGTTVFQKPGWMPAVQSKAEIKNDYQCENNIKKP